MLRRVFFIYLLLIHIPCEIFKICKIPISLFVIYIFLYVLCSQKKFSYFIYFILPYNNNITVNFLCIIKYIYNL